MGSEEPVMSTYMAKWVKVDLVAHEQERSAREEYSRDCIDWQRIEIARLCTEIEKLKAELEQERRRSFQDARISYRGFSYGVSSQNGIDSLRRAIEANNHG